MISQKKIIEMQDYEIVELVQTSSGLFGNYAPSTASMTAFGYMLQQKFPLITGEKIMQRCTDVAANPPKTKDEIKFTPSFLAGIIQSGERTFRPLTYSEREVSIEEKIKYRQQFLKDLYADFDAYKIGKPMKQIIVWDYVARQLLSAGYAERLPEINETQAREKENNIRNTFASQLPFVKQCFDKMITNGTHISQIINVN